METRRLITALVLSVLVMSGWSLLFPAKKPPVAPTIAAPVPQASEAPPAPSESQAGASAHEAGAAVSPQMLAVSTPQEPIGAEREETVLLAGEGFVAEFTNRGGQLLSLRLNGHATAGGEVLDLVRRRGGGPYPFGLATAEGKADPVNEALFAVEKVTEGAPPALIFRYRGPLGEVEKRFGLAAKGLLSTEIRRVGAKRWGIFLGPGLGNPSPEEAASKLVRHRAIFLADGTVSRKDAKGQAEPLIVPGGRLVWAGLDDNYFATVVIPETRVEQVAWQPLFVEAAAAGSIPAFTELPPGGELTKEQKAQPRELLMRLEVEGEQFAARVFMGAKQLDRLNELGLALDQTIELGWFRFLALPFMHALRWIHDHVVSNYGWAIVLMTVLIKILLLPLTHKTMVSMGKMQEMNPKQQAIRARYAGKLRDKQGRMNFEAQRKMNEEIMALYKKEGVNPAGGCLPLVLQLPVFIAFYNILPASVELRHAPWILWIHDLAAHDPYYILPIVMGATQMAQQLMVPAVGNPAQRNMMLAMPVVFTFLFAGFPSGLVLYWLTNNALSIIQQAGYNRWKKSLRKEGVAAGAS